MTLDPVTSSHVALNSVTPTPITPNCMTPNMCVLRLLLTACAAGLCLCMAGHADAASADRERIKAGIARLNKAFDAEEAACRQRFAVTACVEDSRTRRREALAPLRAQTLALDDVERKQRAAERQQTLDKKKQQAAQRPPPPPDSASAPRAAASAPARAPLIARGASQPRASNAAAHRTQAQAEAAERVQAAQKRQQQAQERADRIAARQAERAKKGKPAQPLPVPAASAPTR